MFVLGIGGKMVITFPIGAEKSLNPRIKLNSVLWRISEPQTETPEVLSDSS